MKVSMKKIESLMILRGVNVTELMQAAGLERATYYYIKKKGGTSPRTLRNYYCRMYFAADKYCFLCSTWAFSGRTW